MRILFVGSVKFSESILEALIKSGANIVGCITKLESSFNSDFCDLGPICNENNIPVFHSDSVNNPLGAEMWIKYYTPDIVYCFGWSQIIKPHILKLSKFIGFHPAELPNNRGRHPLIWALVLGLNQTASTFFAMDEGIDTGGIISQKIIPISDSDTAQSLYDKVTQAAITQLPELNNEPVHHEPGNYWRKRTEADGEIDFRMTSKAIYDLVRALSKPYPGATANGVKVWKAEIRPHYNPFDEPGKVLGNFNDGILVKTYDSAILLTDHEFIEIPEYL